MRSAKLTGETDKPKRGRPTKAAVAAKKKGNRGVMGRPKGDAGIINDYKSRMLASPKSAKVLESIFDAALNDDHKHQAAAWKLVLDRVAPVSAFEKEFLKDKGSGQIQINISTTGAPQIDGEIVDGEFVDV
tara:strand:+ start:424 stop:816 length:393 start_codon:yes stop_codon:yes gene_type:complete